MTELIEHRFQLPTLSQSQTLNSDGVHVIDRYLKGRSRGSRDTVLSSLGVVGSIVCGQPDPYLVPWHQFDGITMQELATTLRDSYSPNTCRKVISFVRGIMTELFRLRIMPDEQYRRLMTERLRFGRSAQAGRVIDPTEEKALLDKLREDNSPRGRRDFAMVCLFRYCGLRREELRDLLMSSLDRAGGRIRVLGKGSKERFVFLSPGVLPALDAWFNVRGDEAGPMFVGWKNNHSKPTKNQYGLLIPLNLASINRVLQRRQQECGLEPFTPHDLRRTFATRRLKQGNNINVVKELMGHSSINTTSIYLRYADDDMRESANRDGVIGGEVTPTA